MQNLVIKLEIEVLKPSNFQFKTIVLLIQFQVDLKVIFKKAKNKAEKSLEKNIILTIGLL